MEDNIEEEVKDSPVVDMPVNSQEQPPVATGGIDWEAAAKDMSYSDTPFDPTELRNSDLLADNSDLLAELMSKVLSVSASVKAIDEKLDEATELFKHGQKEMHRLISEAQTTRFVGLDNKKIKKPSTKLYTEEDERIFKLMASAFARVSGQATRMFAQQCNMAVLVQFGHYPGAHCADKKNTGAFHKINGDLQVAVTSKDIKVPSFLEYFTIGVNLLKSLNADIDEEITTHIEAMDKACGEIHNSPVDSSDDLNDSHAGESTRGSAENNEDEVGELH